MTKSARVLRKAARQRQQRIRTVIFGVLVVGIVGLAGFYLKQAFFRPAPPAMAGNVIDVNGSMDGFDKTEMHVKVGQPVTIRLTSLDNSHHTDGGGQHQWAVDELGLVAPGERGPKSEHLVERRAQGVDVVAPIGNATEAFAGMTIPPVVMPGSFTLPSGF